MGKSQLTLYFDFLETLKILKIFLTTFVQNPDAALAHIFDIFPDKTYREVQKTYAKMGTVESTIAAFLGMYMCMLCILQ